jgi:deoxycytidylate deaminase
LVNLGNVKTVYYSEDYRKKDSIAILETCNIKVVRFQRKKK